MSLAERLSRFGSSGFVKVGYRNSGGPMTVPVDREDLAMYLRASTVNWQAYTPEQVLQITASLERLTDAVLGDPRASIGPDSERIREAEEVVADALHECGKYPCRPGCGHRAIADRRTRTIATALRAAGLLPGPDDIVVSREALANLVAHVKHDAVCTVFDEEYMGSECCRHGTCAEAEANDEIHGTWAGTPRRHPALTDAVLAALSQPHPAQEQQT